MYKIYTDGSYKPTTDKGGYASIITENEDCSGNDVLPLVL